MNQARPKIRLFVQADYATGEHIALAQKQAHYLANVMRLRPGDQVAVFNGHDGEWRAEIVDAGKKNVTLQLKERLRAHISSPDIWLAFAPIKNKSELVVEKATELGVSKILPVFTRYSVVKSINAEKLVAHAQEAAEQCERMDVPAIEEKKDLGALLASWPKDRALLYGDESGGGAPLPTLLNSLPPCGGGLGRGGSCSGMSSLDAPPSQPSPARGEGASAYGVLIGPEGGFSDEERRMLKAASFVKPFGMGPRILRADTAAVAALACVQGWLGDWDVKPRFEAVG